MIADHVSRSFRVTPHRTPTLKDALLLRRQSRREEIVALSDVSFEIGSGESVGLIGRNGSGKTTLLRLIAGVLSPTGGTLLTSGSVASLLELGAGFHPDFSGRDNVYLNASLHGLSRAYVREHLDEDLATDTLGPARGSGVLVLREGRWLVEQYVLSVTVPNERFREVRELLERAR